MNPDCEKCGGKCCKIAMFFDKKTTPENVQDLVRMRINAIDTPDFLFLTGACKHLEHGKCTIYRHRPSACRKFKVDSPECNAIRQLEGI